MIDNITDVIEKRSENSEEESKRQRKCIDIARQIVSERSEKCRRQLTYHVTTFGCQMNAKDSEKLSGVLEDCGYVYEEEEKDADVVIFNTCTIRDNADQKLYGHLGSLRNIRKTRKNMIIGLCGCLTQVEDARKKIASTYPFVDLIFGTHNLYDMPRLLLQLLTSGEEEQGAKITEIWDSAPMIVEDIPSKRNYSFKSGVNIMLGCDNFCSYCIVPYVRGRERSRRSSDIINEIEKLADDGVVEVMLLGQNVNSYGKNLDENITFPQLLQKIEKIDGIKRIRFMTSHPKDLSDELIDVMASSEKICRHIHLPLQSGSTKILQSMNRRYTKEQYVELALKIRERIEDIAITTDLIMGYPGETDEDVDDTIDVIEKVAFDGAFTFIYSKRTGTPAALMPQVPEDIVKRNFDRVLEKVQEVSALQAAKVEGRTMDVLVEGINRQDGALVTGRLSNNMNVHFPGDESLIGKIVPVTLTECKGFYYIGNMR